MFGHRFTNQLGFALTNQRSISDHNNRVYSSILSSYNIAVDTFFIMGALLITLSILSALDKKTLNVPKLILHRYLRYTPVLAAVLLYYVSISDLAFNGPVPIGDYKANCKRYWWSTLLHVQNYVNPRNLCSGHIWYLSADFQLFVLSPLLVYPVWKFGWKFLWSLPVLSMMSSVYVLVLCLVKGYRLESDDLEKSDGYATNVYHATHSRMGVWLIGMTFGYILHKTKNQKIKVSQRLNAIFWVLALSSLTTIIVLAQPLTLPKNNQTSLTFNAIYIAFHRPIWGIAICWIIFSCHKLKTGGIIRWFLSLPQWQPIARMSLSIYICHLFYIVTFLMNQKDAFTFELWTMVS